MCRPLRSWKVPSSVSDCSDGGLGISLPRSARVVAVTGPDPSPSQASTSHMKWTRPFHASCVQNARGRRVCRWLTYHTHLVLWQHDHVHLHRRVEWDGHGRSHSEETFISSPAAFPHHGEAGHEKENGADGDASYDGADVVP